MDTDAAKSILESLRWKEDMLITNYAGDRVWLGPCLNEHGVRIGITECCFADDPCGKHKAMAQETK